MCVHTSLLMRIKVGHVCVYLTADEDKGGPCVCTSLLMRIKVGRVCVPHC